MNINDIIGNFNSTQLKQINDFLNSAQGKKFKQNISDANKAEAIKKFKQLSPDDVKNALNGISKEAILKMLK